MSIVKQDDALFRWTESGQDYHHELGASLRDLAPAISQQVFRWNSADLTTVRTVAIGSGVEDLSATIVWDGNPWQLQAFLAAGRRGASITFFPSKADPSESYDCILVSAGEVQLAPDPDFWWEYRYRVGVTLRRIDGGSWRDLTTGTLLYYRAGDSLPGLTFTRSGAVGKYADEDGVLQDAAANIFRIDWIDTDSDDRMDTPTLLLEAARTNLCLQSEDLSTTWSNIGTPTLGTPHTASGVSLDLLGDDSGAAAEGKSQAVTFTGDAVKAVSVHWKPGASPTPSGDEIVMRDTTAGANRLFARVSDAGDGSPSLVMSTGTYLGAIPMAGGVYRLLFASTAVTAANNNEIRLYAGRTGTVADTGDVYWGGVQCEDALTPSSYIATTTATVTRNADTLYSDFLAAPQEMTGYLKCRAYGTEQAANLGLLRIGDATASSGASLQIFTGTAKRMRLWLDNGVDATVTATFGASGEIDYLDDVELRYVLGSDGALTFEVAVSEVSVETVTASAPASGLPDDWVGTRIYHGSLGSSNQGLVQILASKIAKGTKTMATMRSL